MRSTFALLAIACVLSPPPTRADGPPQLGAMQAQIDAKLGPWKHRYQLYLLWPRSKSGSTEDFLPRPEGWSWAHKGSLKPKGIMSSELKYTARLDAGYVTITREKARITKKPLITTPDYAIIEPAPGRPPADPRVAEWTALIEAEYGDRFHLYALWPRWLATPEGWVDAFREQGSLRDRAPSGNYKKMKGKGELTFRENKKKGRKWTYRLIEMKKAQK